MFIAAKDKDTTYIGISLRERWTPTPIIWGPVSDLLLPDNMPIWKVAGHKGVMMASGGVGIVKDTLRYTRSLYKGDLSAETVIREVVPKIHAVSKRFDQISKNNRYSGGYVIADAEHIFEIKTDLMVFESDHASSGIGELTDSVFMATEGKPAVERILAAFRMVNECEHDAIFPVAIYDVRTGRRRIFRD